MQIGRAAAAGLAAWLLVATAAESGRSEPRPARIVVAQASAAEIEFWRSVEGSKDPAELEAYLEAYPTGQFAPLANIRLKKLRSEGLTGPAAGASKPAEPPPGLAARSAETPKTDIPRAPAAKVRGWVGAELRPINEQRARELGLAAASGAEIVSLFSFGPAASHGLKPNDVVLSVDGEPLADHAHLIRLISAIAPTKTTELGILRGGQRQTVKVTVGNFFNDQWAAAHRGDPGAMHNLGAMFSSGQLVDRDPAQATAWIRRAADAGNVQAMFRLGSLLARGELVDRDPAQANVWFRRAADAGNVQAMSALGWRYARGLGFQQDDREAVRWYRQAADAGDTMSMLSVGHHYRRGRGVERDPAEAARWSKMAGEKGNSSGLYEYGLALMRGDGVAKNETLAVDYFRRAAKLNNALAFGSLGNAYYFGWGVDVDKRQATEWYRKSAERSVPLGFFGLGWMYERGEGGLPKDRNEAITHYRKAAEGGVTGALEQLKKLKASAHDPAEVQTLLSDLGFDPGPGRKTADAIRKFQQSRGLPMDGAASLRLIGQLRDAMKQRTAAATTAAPSANASSTGGADLDALMNLEKLD